MDAATAEERPEPGQLLLDWLRLLGWRVQVYRGEPIELVAERHLDRSRVELRVEDASLADAAWRLFERALGDEDEDAAAAA